MSNRTLRTALHLGLGALLAAGLACSEPNPIVGVWVVDAEATPGGARAAADLANLEELEFRQDKLVIGSKTVDVRYEIDGDRVIVTEANAGEGEVYTLLENDRLQKSLPMGIVVVYRRVGATPAVSEGPDAGR